MTTFRATNGRVEVEDGASLFADGIYVDVYGDECGEWWRWTGADTWIPAPMVNGAVKRNVTRRRPMFQTNRFCLRCDIAWKESCRSCAVHSMHVAAVKRAHLQPVPHDLKRSSEGSVLRVEGCGRCCTLVDSSISSTNAPRRTSLMFGLSMSGDECWHCYFRVKTPNRSQSATQSGADFPWTFPGCSVANVTDNVCGEEACSPGPVGYTCGKMKVARALRSVYSLVFAFPMLAVKCVLVLVMDSLLHFCLLFSVQVRYTYFLLSLFIFRAVPLPFLHVCSVPMRQTPCASLGCYFSSGQHACAGSC